MKTLTFKVSEAESEHLRAQARKERLSLSEFLRRRLRGKPNDTTPKVKRRKCRTTGAMIFAPAPHLAPLSTDSVKDMLAEFP
ncbi:MAG TPA: hypothetical protein EYQ50_29115 [Verrucomicrobiales bacterium]|jgi:hypothetical protein|nr:hypothetical protein [Verrucomicrobiales bacterium]HIL69220.1 hypothetical protein [Verrucomicrobiota bacterium]